MSKGENKIMRRRLANAYLSSVISISLVLLLVGVASMLLVNAGSVSDYFKENMQVSVLLKDAVSEEKAMAYSDALLKEEFIKTTKYISKEQGQMELEEMLGEDFMDIFETSPIPASIEITLNADYVSTDSLEVVKTKLAKSDLVAEVNYQVYTIPITKDLRQNPCNKQDKTNADKLYPRCPSGITSRKSIIDKMLLNHWIY